MNKWISVKDRLPDYYKDVWCTDGNKVLLGRIIGRHYKPPKKDWVEAGTFSNENLFGITHWMEYTGIRR